MIGAGAFVAETVMLPGSAVRPGAVVAQGLLAASHPDEEPDER
ncbi:MAG TPA: hypothetical protein VFF79_06845 [Conexibacter sp.]|nr:hypothetical protein [Conexibacter sp.]